MTKYIPAEAPSIDNLPELLLKPEQCEDMVKMQECIVKKLEECSQPTPANIAESLFKFIKQVTPCGTQVSIFLNIFHDVFRQKYEKIYTTFVLSATFYEIFHKKFF